MASLFDTIKSAVSSLMPERPKPRPRLSVPETLQQMERFAREGCLEAIEELEHRMNKDRSMTGEGSESWFRLARPKLENDISSRLGKKYTLIIPHATKQAYEVGITLAPMESYCLVSKAGQGVIQCIALVTAEVDGKKLKKRHTERRRFRTIDSLPQEPGQERSSRVSVEKDPFFRSFDDA